MLRQAVHILNTVVEMDGYYPSISMDRTRKTTKTGLPAFGPLTERAASLMYWQKD